MTQRLESTLCLCGKHGWTEREDALRVAKEMNGRRAKGRATVAAYRCTRTISRLWHAGSQRTQGAAP